MTAKTLVEAGVIYHCPECGSADVEEQLCTWYNANTGEEGDQDHAGTPIAYYCNDCAETVLHLEERQVEVEVNAEPPDKYPHYVTIGWGEHFPLEDDDKPVTYRFETKAELDAFMLAVEEADGWLGYDLIEDSRDGN